MRIFRRSLLWLIPIILIPLGVLGVMQYRLLRKLEKTTASAERNWLRGAVEGVAADLETYYRTATERSLDLSPPILDNPAATGEHFGRNRVGGAKTYFTARFSHVGTDYSFFDAWGNPKQLTAAEMEAVKLSTISWAMLHKMRSVVPTRALGIDNRDVQNRVVLRPITDDALHVAGVAGIIFDDRRARDWMLNHATQAVRKHQHYRYLALRIGDDKRFINGAFVTQPLGFAFSDWRIGIRDTCMTPEQTAAQNFRINAISGGAAGLVLFGAIGLALSAAFRQMRLSQMKSDFVSNVSHELRTPLSSIRVFGEYMRLGRVTKDDKIREYGEYIEAESRRLTALINNILDFSKIESAEKKYRFDEACLVDVVEHIVTAFEMPLRDRGVTIAFDAPSEPLPPVRLDRDAIGQAIVNLLDNAVKYSGEGKEISVSVRRDGQTVRIAIRDRGIGIAAHEQKKIFEKFYRVGTSLVHDVKGSGLGLAIVSHIVNAHGGRVEVASQPGEGSTFTIILPCGGPLPSAAHGTAEGSAASALGATEQA